MVMLAVAISACQRDHVYDTPEESQETGDPGNSGDSGNSGDPGDPGNPGNSGDSGDSGDSGNPGGSDDTPDSETLARAALLRGQWRGTISTQYYDDYGNLHKGVYTLDMQFDQYEVNTAHGRGLHTDFEGDEMVYRSPFKWTIDTETKSIHLRYDDLRQMDIITYQLDKESFSGTMISADGLETDVFQLSRYTYSNTSL